MYYNTARLWHAENSRTADGQRRNAPYVIFGADDPLPQATASESILERRILLSIKIMRLALLSDLYQ